MKYSLSLIAAMVLVSPCAGIEVYSENPFTGRAMENLFCFWAVLIKKAEHTAAPANPNASATTRAVLEYFHSLPRRPDKRVVSGQFLDHGASASLDEIAEAHEKTGRWVGMVGGDSYGRTMAQIRKDGYSQPAGLGKPFGLTEFGPFKQLNWAENPRNDYDYGQFIREVAEQMPLCTSFLIWHQNHGLQFQQNAKQCLDHPWTVNRADLPSFGRQAGASSRSADEAREQ